MVRITCFTTAHLWASLRAYPGGHFMGQPLISAYLSTPNTPKGHSLHFSHRLWVPEKAPCTLSRNCAYYVSDLCSRSVKPV